MGDLYQSIDYEHLLKTTQSAQVFYKKPQQEQQKIISSKDLFAAQSVLSQKKATEPVAIASSFKISKSGFKAMKISNSSPKTVSPSPFFDSASLNDLDAGMVDIESYIAQQNEVSSPSENSPDNDPTPAAPIYFIDSSPEPKQRNSSFHVVKKAKPKRK